MMKSMATLLKRPRTQNLSLDDIFAKTEDRSITIMEDLVVLSACNYRLKRDDPNYRFMSLTNSDLRNRITQEDKDFADKIKSHYSKMILWNTLKGKTLTTFKRDLGQLINTMPAGEQNIYTYKEKLVGIAYKLPEFYLYDQRLSTLFDNFKGPLKAEFYRKQVRSLKFKDKLALDRKHHKGNEYWFVDENDDHYRLFISKDNNLTNIFDYMVATKGTVRIKGDFFAKKKDDFNFFSSEAWTVEV